MTTVFYRACRHEIDFWPVKLNYFYINRLFIERLHLNPCVSLFWFGLDKCQVPTKTTLSLPLLSWVGRGDMMKGSRVETRTGRDHSPITVMDKAD